MNTKMKTELVNDVVTGLLVAATFAAVAPADAFAQFSATVNAARTNVASPFVTIVSYVSYAVGTVLAVAGIASAKKHADNPAQEPLGKSLGRLGAGAAFLAAPSLIGMVQNTGSDTLAGTSSGAGTIQF